ncbi:MAG: hypothetical protein DRJ66_07010 [Thermoprotei archaeon]|nr:MAG: hypothetical protein DRJ66_07010 [Thermoprotei archaeon]RLF21027.1 MAG: hypothetical protein DRZ82_00120 [Thermoprotei archaeon]
MGGRKKLTLKQMEKQQLLRLRKEEEKRRRVKEEKEKQVALTFVDPSIYEAIKKEAPKATLLTPYIIASKYNVKLSTAKKILRQLEKEGLIQLISRSRRTEIFRGAKARIPPPPEPILPFLR